MMLKVATRDDVIRIGRDCRTIRELIGKLKEGGYTHVQSGRNRIAKVSYSGHFYTIIKKMVGELEPKTVKLSVVEKFREIKRLIDEIESELLPKGYERSAELLKMMAKPRRKLVRYSEEEKKMVEDYILGKDGEFYAYQIARELSGGDKEKQGRYDGLVRCVIQKLLKEGKIELVKEEEYTIKNPFGKIITSNRKRKVYRVVGRE